MQIDWGSPCWVGQSSEPVEAGDFAELIQKCMSDELGESMLGVGGRGAPELGPYPTRNEVFNGLPHYNYILAKGLFSPHLFVCYTLVCVCVCACAHVGVRR